VFAGTPFEKQLW